MKKVLNIIVCCFMFLSLFIDCLVVNAEEVYEGVVISDGGLKVRKGPGTTYENIGVIPKGFIVELANNEKVKDEGGCENGWYKILYPAPDTNYVCSDFLKVSVKENTPMTDEAKTEYEKKLQGLGFPKSYWPDLITLHEKYPTWEFEALKTNLIWKEAVEAESVLGKSLIQTSNKAYLSTEPGSYDYNTDKYIPLEGSNWYAANKETVAYYLDPRNFLNENHIFMFEKLSYDETYQTEAAVKGVISESSYLNKYVKNILDAGKEFNINPIYITSRIRQETGLNVGAATSGKEFTYEGKKYSGLYNLFNIGATTGKNPVLKGLIWANGGTNGTMKKYGRPWTSIEKSIHGGTEFLANSYIGRGQYTNYLQKFNVNPYGKSPVYTNQYMTNIQAPISEAMTTYRSYEKMDLLKTPFKFSIPVFVDMGETSKLPTNGSSNNHLKNIMINNQAITDFDHEIFNYDYNVSDELKEVEITATALSDKAKIEGLGKIPLTEEKTKVIIKVTAENGKVQEYSINIIKTKGISISVPDIIKEAAIKNNENYLFGFTLNSDVSLISKLISKVSSTAVVTVKDKSDKVKTTGILATGDNVTITNGESVKSYTVIINGDCSGDGKISIHDLLIVQKYILKYKELDGAFYEAADASNDKEITILDLLKIQKHILGYSEIEQ